MGGKYLKREVLKHTLSREWRVLGFESIYLALSTAVASLMLCWFNCVFNGMFVLFCNFGRIYALADPKRTFCESSPG